MACWMVYSYFRYIIVSSLKAEFRSNKQVSFLASFSIEICQRHLCSDAFYPRTMNQVELSVKHAFGIPVARDSRLGDIKQRGMRGCLFYDAGEEIERRAIAI